MTDEVYQCRQTYLAVPSNLVLGYGVESGCCIGTLVVVVDLLRIRSVSVSLSDKAG